MSVSSRTSGGKLPNNASILRSEVTSLYARILDDSPVNLTITRGWGWDFSSVSRWSGGLSSAISSISSEWILPSTMVICLSSFLVLYHWMFGTVDEQV